MGTEIFCQYKARFKFIARCSNFKAKALFLPCSMMCYQCLPRVTWTSLSRSLRSLPHFPLGSPYCSRLGRLHPPGTSVFRRKTSFLVCLFFRTQSSIPDLSGILISVKEKIKSWNMRVCNHSIFVCCSYCNAFDIKPRSIKK